MKTKYSSITINLLIVMLMTLTLNSFGQEDISIYGVVRDHNDNKKIPNVDIIIYENGKKLFSKKTNLNGKYDFVLEFNKSYRIDYIYPYYVTKFLTINATDVPDIDRIGGFEMNIDMTLFKEIDGLDVSLLKDPIGKAQFDANKGEMAWDMAYTNMMQRKIRELMRKHDEKIVEEEAREAKVRDNFANLVRLGDAGVRNKKFDNAVGYYTEALIIIPDDEIVIQKLADAKASAADLAFMKEKRANYDQFVGQGDSYFNRKEWSNALTAFQSANELFPDESYPQVKITDLNKKLEAERNQAKVAAQVMALIMEGDKLVAIEEFDDGIAKYEEVLTLQANNAEAKQKLADAKNKREAWLKQQDLDAQYLEYIALADEDFNQEKYETAIQKYRNASNLKPNESYPPDQINKAEEFLSLAKADEAKKKSFDELVKKGDATVSKKEYKSGIGFYEQALDIIPKDEAVELKIKSAQDALAAMLAAEEALRQQKDIEERFAGFVKDGDNSFGVKNYVDAIGFYEDALELKPADPDVEAKIAETRKAMNNLLASKQVDEKYAEAIRKADKDFNNFKYEPARDYYQQASALKPKEDYPKNQLLEIDALLAKIAADEEALRQKDLEAQAEADKQLRFQELESEGDRAVSLSDYSGGVGKYTEALLIFSDNQRVIDKKKNAERLLAEANSKKDIDDQYNQLIANADAEFDSQNYKNARGSYQQAINVKANEQYPKNRIDEIDLLLLELAKNKKNDEKTARFDALEAEGDAKVASTEYLEAIDKFELALEIIPDNTRVQQKITNARKMFESASSARELDEMYNEFITKADSQFNTEEYKNAKRNYQQAYGLKPMDYPKNRIAEIDKILLDIERQKAEDEAARLAEMQNKNKDRSWEDNSSDEEQYIVAARNAQKNAEDLKYAELLAYQEALRRTREGYVENGVNTRNSNASIINEQKDLNDYLYDQIKKEDDLRQIAEVKMVKEMDATWVKEMNAEQRERATSSTLTEDYKQYQKDLNSKHNEVIMGNYNESQQLAEMRYKKFGEHEDIRLKNIKEIENKKEGLKTFNSDNSANQQKRIEESSENIIEMRKTQIQNYDKGEEMANSNYSNLQSETEMREMETEVWKDKSQLKRELELEEINHTKWPGEKDPYDYVETDKSRGYKQGITEETFDEGNNKVIKRMVVKGNKVDEYKMVVTNHGTYYFKNGESITKSTWNTGTENINNSD